MKHPPQEADIIPGGKSAGVIVATIIAIVIGVLTAYGLGRCKARELGVAWSPPSRPQVPAEVNAMETGYFAVEAQGLEMHGVADDWLSTYGWVDRDTQIIRVPIEVAFELYLARQRERGGTP